ncbi:hypothetical protein [Microbispora hainanensis]|uniref:Uncharacterized protein n=1 Tax=Microbispora hainanensis TaxID=568844 RepID=A0A544YM52_9ACTN|nr:hypothetical protein [Microbispora hainanensis]TQS17849.1 hypothetical protein FLX08_27430 [Microbispora hainanensis]
MAFVVALSAPLSSTPLAGAAFAAGHGDGSGKGHAKQVTDGRNTANTPAIASGPRQISRGRRNVNAPAGNNSLAFTGLQQVTSVSVFTDTLSGRCVDGIDDCGINQNLNARRQKAR